MLILHQINNKHNNNIIMDRKNYLTNGKLVLNAKITSPNLSSYKDDTLIYDYTK